jgi:Right handed beta helix region
MIHARLWRPLALVCLAVAIAAAGGARAAGVVTVPAGGNLQEAIDNARPGDTLVLAAGATYVGNFVLPALPAKSGNSYITIRSAGEGDAPPRAGQRILPSHAVRLAKLQSGNREPALRTAPGAYHWRLQLLEFLPTQGGTGDIIRLGDGGPAQRELSQVPRDLAIDRCYIHGDAVLGQKRGIALNSASTTITNSYISDIKAVGQDTQAIAGWNGPGPYTIENNYLEGAGENFILGGSDPPIAGLVTEDVVFRRNHLAKPLAWRSEKWQVKNLFELKNARRVLVEGNLMENVWQEAQVGYAILLTPRNQDGKAPWVTVEDVTIRRNLIRNAGGAIQIIGEDSNYPSGSTRRVRIVDNLFYAVDAAAWGGSGAFALIGEGPSDIAIEHNTVSQSGNIILAYGGTHAAPKTISGFVFRDNLIRHNQYGVIGAERAIGDDTLKSFFPDAVFQSNAIAGGDSGRYPKGNTFLRDSDFDAAFMNATAGDYRLKPASRLRGAASDGGDMGADVAAIAQALGTRTPR